MENWTIDFNGTAGAFNPTTNIPEVRGGGVVAIRDLLKKPAIPENFFFNGKEVVAESAYGVCDRVHTFGDQEGIFFPVVKDYQSVYGTHIQIFMRQIRQAWEDRVAAQV